MSCPDLPSLAAWCLGELPAADGEDIEEHYFSCQRCLEQLERMQRLLDQLQASLPPVLTPERRGGLEAALPASQVVRVRAGDRATLHMSAVAPLGLWLLQTPPLGLVRVDLEARSADGTLLFRLEDVPFDSSRGEVALACQLHYRALPGSPEMTARLTAQGPNGPQTLAEYTLDHQFAGLEKSL